MDGKSQTCFGGETQVARTMKPSSIYACLVYDISIEPHQTYHLYRLRFLPFLFDADIKVVICAQGIYLFCQSLGTVNTRGLLCPLPWDNLLARSVSALLDT